MEKKKQSLHDKAIRLVEGGVVEVDGHSVKMGHQSFIFDPCFVCEMDSLCHKGNEFCNLCEECDYITGEDCFLYFSNTKMEDPNSPLDRLAALASH